MLIAAFIVAYLVIGAVIGGIISRWGLGPEELALLAPITWPVTIVVLLFFYATLGLIMGLGMIMRFVENL